MRRNPREPLKTTLRTSVRFWGGLSVLASLASLTLPWWGITLGLPAYSASWGLFFGPHSPSYVTWFQDRIDALLAPNYSLMTGLVLVTALSTALGTILKRLPILVISVIISLTTVLAFLIDVGIALARECDQVGGLTVPCISGFIGEGASGSNLVTWGFQAGFYTFIASSMLVLIAIAIQRMNR